MPELDTMAFTRLEMVRKVIDEVGPVQVETAETVVKDALNAIPIMVLREGMFYYEPYFRGVEDQRLQAYWLHVDNNEILWPLIQVRRSLGLPTQNAFFREGRVIRHEGFAWKVLDGMDITLDEKTHQVLSFDAYKYQMFKRTDKQPIDLSGSEGQLQVIQFVQKLVDKGPRYYGNFGFRDLRFDTQKDNGR